MKMLYIGSYGYHHNLSKLLLDFSPIFELYLPQPISTKLSFFWDTLYDDNQPFHKNWMKKQMRKFTLKSGWLVCWSLNPDCIGMLPHAPATWSTPWRIRKKQARSSHWFWESQSDTWLTGRIAIHGCTLHLTVGTICYSQKTRHGPRFWEKDFEF